MYVSRSYCPVGLTGIRRGLGCAGDPNCKCGGGCNRGMGLFDSMDFTTWGIGEWGVIGVGAYLVLSLAGDAMSTRQSIRRYSRRRRRKAES